MGIRDRDQWGHRDKGTWGQGAFGDGVALGQGVSIPCFYIRSMGIRDRETMGRGIRGT